MRENFPFISGLASPRPIRWHLWRRLGAILGCGPLILSTLPAPAAELIIPEASAPVAAPAPKPAPQPQRAPAVKAAPTPKPVVKSVPLTPAPKVKPSTPDLTQPVDPVIIIQRQTPGSATSGADHSPSSPARTVRTPGQQPIKDAYIDTSGQYDLGSTPAQPNYERPSNIVLSERSTGCRAVLGGGQSLGANLCGTPPARTVRVTPKGGPGRGPLKLNDQWRSQPITPPQLLAARTQSDALLPPPPQGPSSLTPTTAPSFPATIPGSNPLKLLISDQKMLFPLIMPAQITLAFGWRTHPLTGQQQFNTGANLDAPLGTPVVAAYSGQVATADYFGGYGLSILLHHEQGQYATRYAHLSQLFVQPGQIVEKGTVIGLVGNTGYSTTPRLHFETLQNTPEGFVVVDPGAQLQVALAALIGALQVAKSQPQPLAQEPPQPGTAPAAAQPPGPLTVLGDQPPSHPQSRSGPEF